MSSNQVSSTAWTGTICSRLAALCSAACCLTSFAAQATEVYVDVPVSCASTHFSCSFPLQRLLRQRQVAMALQAAISICSYGACRLRSRRASCSMCSSTSPNACPAAKPMFWCELAFSCARAMIALLQVSPFSVTLIGLYPHRHIRTRLARDVQRSCCCRDCAALLQVTGRSLDRLRPRFSLRWLRWHASKHKQLASSCGM